MFAWSKFKSTKNNKNFDKMTVSKFGELLTLWKLAANAKFQHNFSTIMPDRQKKITYCIRSDSTFDKADFLNLKLVIIKRIPYYMGLLFIGLLNSNVFQLHY